MDPFELHVHISAPRQRVFGALGDLAARPAWMGHFMEDLRLASPRTAEVGAAARFRLEPPLRKLWAETRIAEADPPRRLAEQGRLGRLGKGRLDLLWELTEQAGVTRVELTVWCEAGTPGDRLRIALGFRRWLRGRLRTSLERLRRLLEEDPDRPLERVGIAGFEPLTAPRFGVPVGRVEAEGGG